MKVRMKVESLRTCCLRLALAGGLAATNGYAIADMSEATPNPSQLEISEAIRASSLVWKTKSISVFYDVRSEQRDRGDEVVKFAHQAFSEIFNVVGIDLVEVKRDADIVVHVIDPPASPMVQMPERSCGFNLTQDDREISHAEVTLVLGFASRECVRGLGLAIAGLSGNVIHNVRGTLLSRALVSDELNDVDRRLLELAYAPESVDGGLSSEYEAVSRFVAVSHDAAKSAQWSALLEAAQSATTIDEQRKYAHSALAFASGKDIYYIDYFRLGTTMYWLSVFEGRSGHVDDAIEKATAALELLKKEDAELIDQARIYSLEVNLKQLRLLRRDEKPCEIGSSQLENFPQSLGHIVRSAELHVRAFCDLLEHDLPSALTNIQDAMLECATAYFGVCPAWEASSLFAEIQSARGQFAEALEMHTMAKATLEQMGLGALRCGDLQHIRLRIAQLNHQLGALEASREMAVEALGDEACRTSTSPEAVSEFLRLAEGQ